MVARFCWSWSNKTDSNGAFVKDVKIGDFAMPWETHDKITSIPKGYVRWYKWAYRTEGIRQVGCIYTAHGFEFDYIGVIIGNDSHADKTSGKLSADPAATKDPMLKRCVENFEKNEEYIQYSFIPGDEGMLCLFY